MDIDEPTAEHPAPVFVERRGGGLDEDAIRAIVRDEMKRGAAQERAGATGRSLAFVFAIFVALATVVSAYAAMMLG